MTHLERNGLLVDLTGRRLHKNRDTSRSPIVTGATSAPGNIQLSPFTSSGVHTESLGSALPQLIC